MKRLAVLVAVTCWGLAIPGCHSSPSENATTPPQQQHAGGKPSGQTGAAAPGPMAAPSGVQTGGNHAGGQAGK